MADQPIQTGEAIPLLLFGFRVQLCSPVAEFRRQGRLTRRAGFLRRFFCRRLVFHPISSLSFFAWLHSCQRPFAPRALPRFKATMDASDSRSGQGFAVISSRSILGRRFCFRLHPAAGSPRFLGFPLLTRRPLSPRGGLPLRVINRFIADIGFGIFGTVATPNLCFEADSGSLALRLVELASRGFRPRVAPPPARSASCLMISLRGDLLSYRRVPPSFAWRTKDTKVERRRLPPVGAHPVPGF